jgi:hypothetical protein
VSWDRLLYRRGKEITLDFDHERLRVDGFFNITFLSMRRRIMSAETRINPSD